MTDNGRHKRTLEFDVMDAPMLAAALRLAACTAMMCGHKDAQKRLDQYRDVVAQLVPPEAKLFDEECWAEIGMALADAPTFEVSIRATRWDPKPSRWSQGKIVVTIGKRSWENDRIQRYAPGDPTFKAVFDVLQQLAPIDCVGTLQDVWNLDTVG